MNEIRIESMLPEHWSAVAEIYRQGFETGLATFERQIPEWDKWDNNHLSFCRSIALVNNQIAGWAALSPVSSRAVYAGVAEVSIYIEKSFRGKHIEIQLLQNLISGSEKNGIWTLQFGIFKKNTASIALHQKAGFRMIGHREKVGKLNDEWLDTVLMERRSKVTGVS